MVLVATEEWRLQVLNARALFSHKFGELDNLPRVRVLPTMTRSMRKNRKKIRILLDSSPLNSNRASIPLVPLAAPLGALQVTSGEPPVVPISEAQTAAQSLLMMSKGQSH